MQSQLLQDAWPLGSEDDRRNLDITELETLAWPLAQGLPKQGPAWKHLRLSINSSDSCRGKENGQPLLSPTLTKASRTSRACSLLSGVDTVSPRVMRVRLVRQFIRSGGFT